MISYMFFEKRFLFITFEVICFLFISIEIKLLNKNKEIRLFI